MKLSKISDLQFRWVRMNPKRIHKNIRQNGFRFKMPVGETLIFLGVEQMKDEYPPDPSRELTYPTSGKEIHHRLKSAG